MLKGIRLNDSRVEFCWILEHLSVFIWSCTRVNHFKASMQDYITVRCDWIRAAIIQSNIRHHWSRAPWRPSTRALLQPSPRNNRLRQPKDPLPLNPSSIVYWYCLPKGVSDLASFLAKSKEHTRPKRPYTNIQTLRQGTQSVLKRVVGISPIEASSSPNRIALIRRDLALRLARVILPPCFTACRNWGSPIKDGSTIQASG